MENNANLFFILVLLLIRRKSYTLTHCNNYVVTGSNGPQMLCPGLSEQDTLMTTSWTCQVFAETQQKKEHRDNVQHNTFHIKTVF